MPFRDMDFEQNCKSNHSGSQNLLSCKMITANILKRKLMRNVKCMMWKNRIFSSGGAGRWDSSETFFLGYINYNSDDESLQPSVPNF